MLRFIKYLLITPIAILFLIFAFANRHVVNVSFDPFTSGDIPAFELDAPLFVVIILSMMIGVIAGGLAVWFSQGRHRRAERVYRAETQRLQAELLSVRSSALPVPLSRSA